MDDLDLPGLGGPNAAIRLVRGAAVGRLSLSSEEMTLVAAIQGEIQIREVMRRSGLPSGRAQTALVALRRKKIIEPVVEPGASGSSGATGPQRSVEVDPLDLSDPNCDLELERRREISLLYAQLELLSPYELLAVDPKAEPRAVKEAYFERTKRFHPDRFFGKRLGRLKPKVEAIFKAITQASDLLADPAMRKSYDASRVDAHLSAEDRAVQESRAAERRARLIKRSPYLQRLGTASEFEKRARKAMEDEKWTQAAADFAAAAALDPNDKELVALAQEAKRRADLVRAQELVSGADMAIAQGRDNEAVERLAQAAVLAPKTAKILRRAVPAMLDAGRDPQSCRESAQKWVEAAPSDAEAWASLGRAMIAGGDDKGGKKALEKALTIDPRQAYARSVLRKFWPF